MNSEAIGESSLPQRRQIICVDDDAQCLRCQGELLEDLGYCVKLCGSPAAALSCDLGMFDLGVVDFDLPGLNGRELLLRMRAAGARFPIILVTGYLGSLSYEDRVLFTHCVDKCEPVRSLVEMIARLLDPDQLPDYGI
jgi:CheY-like chemotaxis protein